MIGIAGAFMLFAGLVVTVALVWLKQPGTSTLQPVASPVTHASDQSAQQALSSWWQGGAKERFDALIRDSNAAGDVHDLDSLAQSCAAIKRDVQSLQAYDSAPDAEYQRYLAAALADYAQGTTDCLAGISANSAELLNQGTQEIGFAVVKMQQATARVKEINRN